MAKEKFILASLEDPESKELAQVISSNTSRKILDLLSHKDMSESEISKKLNIPLTTAHYNIQQLLKAKLIETKQFKWSEKGKKIKYYKLANKLIIIAPKSQSNFLDKIKTVIPVALIGTLTAGLIHIFTKSFKSTTFKVARVSQEAAQEDMALAGAQVPTIVAPEPNYALWFFFGLITAIILYLIISYWRSRK